MPAKRCFVISPIGDVGSEVREHADDVFDFIIKPAMDEVGIGVYRADHDQQVGRITDQMFESILTDDLCIAVVSSDNPNVYYELAIAQCAARPVIILNQKGHPLPFDLKDLRVVEYTLRPRMIFDRVYVKQIVDMARDLEAKEWEVPIPFGTDLFPLRPKRGAGSFEYRERQEEFALSRDWMKIIDSATRELDFCGIHLRYWTRMPDFVTLIDRKAQAECRVRFLIMHPGNPALPSYINPGVTVGLEQMLEDLRYSKLLLEDLARSNQNIELREMLTGCHRQQIVRADNTLFASLVLYSEQGRRSPIIECSPPSSFFEIIRCEFEAIWRANPPTGANINGVLPARLAAVALADKSSP